MEKMTEDEFRKNEKIVDEYAMSQYIKLRERIEKKFSHLDPQALDIFLLQSAIKNAKFTLALELSYSNNEEEAKERYKIYMRTFKSQVFKFLKKMDK